MVENNWNKLCDVLDEIGWVEEKVGEHAGTYTHTYTHLHHSSSLCAFFFLIDQSYWCTECWKSESINKRKSFLRSEWLKGRVYPHAVHLSAHLCTCTLMSVCVVCVHSCVYQHISLPLKWLCRLRCLFPSTHISLSPPVSPLLSPDSQSWLVNV